MNFDNNDIEYMAEGLFNELAKSVHEREAREKARKTKSELELQLLNRGFRVWVYFTNQNELWKLETEHYISVCLLVKIDDSWAIVDGITNVHIDSLPISLNHYIRENYQLTEKETR